MCDSMSPYFTNSSNTLPAYLSGTGPSPHHEQYNGEVLQHHMLGSCHENGRGPPIGPPQLLSYSPHQHAHHHHHQSIHYGHQHPHPQYPRFPPYDRLPEQHSNSGKPPQPQPQPPQQGQAQGQHCGPVADGGVVVSHNGETSPYYSNCAGSAPPPPSQVGVPSGQQQAQQQQQQPLVPLAGQTASQYEPCSGRGSITPPSLDGSNGPVGGQYGSCKMQPMLAHTDSMPPIGHNSPSPIHGQHQLYGSGPVGSPSQNSNSAISSPLYPWMRSQFGESFLPFRPIISLRTFHSFFSLKSLSLNCLILKLKWLFQKDNIKTFPHSRIS